MRENTQVSGERELEHNHHPDATSSSFSPSTLLSVSHFTKIFLICRETLQLGLLTSGVSLFTIFSGHVVLRRFIYRSDNTLERTIRLIIHQIHLSGPLALISHYE